jgi:hypothetical protein
MKIHRKREVKAQSKNNKKRLETERGRERKRCTKNKYKETWF